MLYDEFIRILKSFFSDKKTLNLEVEYSAFSGYLAIIAVFAIIGLCVWQGRSGGTLIYPVFKW